jgi:hypothetical protein
MFDHVASHMEADTPDQRKTSISAVLVPLAWVTASGVAMAGWAYGISYVAWKLFAWSGLI